LALFDFLALLLAMVPSHRSYVEVAVSDRKPLSDEINEPLSPRVGECQRIRIDALCRSPLSPRAGVVKAPNKEFDNSAESTNQNRETLGADTELPENSSIFLASPSKELHSKSTLRYFSVHLVIAAVAEGNILGDNGTRKTKCVLDQLTRNVSKEQNQV
jgi:hypothetical protein